MKLHLTDKLSLIRDFAKNSHNTANLGKQRTEGQTAAPVWIQMWFPLPCFVQDKRNYKIMI